MFKVVLTDYEFDTLEYEECVFTESGLEISFIKAQCRTEDEVIGAARMQTLSLISMHGYLSVS